MSERIDHAAEAVNFLGAVSFDTYGDDDRKVALAQVHATLALVEQQRIANLIALGIGTSRREVREAVGLE